MILPKLLSLVTLTLSFAQIALAAPKSQIDNIIWTDVKHSHASAQRRNDLLNELRPRSGSELATRSTATRDKRRPTKAKRIVDPSAIPLSGYIQVTRTSNNQLLGYVKSTYINSSNNKRFGLTSGKGSALAVTGTSSTSGPIQLTESNGPDANYPFLGFVSDSTNSAVNPNNLASSSSNFCSLTGSKSTAANAPPTVAGNSYAGARASESTIWTYNTVSKQLTAQWVNNDSSKPTTILWYNQDLDTLLIVGSNTAYTSARPQYTSYAVTFTVVA